MIDTKLIKDSEYFPIGIRKIEDGGLFIDVDKIKSCMFNEDCIKIEYWDGSYMFWYPKVGKLDAEIVNNINLAHPEYLPKLMAKYPPDNWFEKDIQALEEDKKQNPSLYDLSKLKDQL